MGRGPHRRYFVLAAERLANLITTIREAYPSETITVMGHSQGTLITLLAQALLLDRRKRCADCLIMVASPYSLSNAVTPAGGDTLNTLIKIVSGVTDAPYALPPLRDLQAGQPHARGRAGRAWRAEQGRRIGKDGTTVVFPERDNRGKVYLYFSPDDSTVGLDTVAGIGTFGVPDLFKGRLAMKALQKLRFHQRLWTKRVRNGQPVRVGDAPSFQPLRAKGEPRYAAGWSLAAVASAAPLPADELLHINGETLVPPHVPQMFGGEAVRGTATTSGMDRPDAVTRDIALGNDWAQFPWVQLPVEYDGSALDVALDRFNRASKDDGDHTRSVRRKHGEVLERELTPNEARRWMATSPRALDTNSYHSAVLRDAENHRWVTAMDVAIGQGHSLDDPAFRELLLLMADWRTEGTVIEEVKDRNPQWKTLPKISQDLLEASAAYYDKGTFPPEHLVDLKRLPFIIDGSIPS